MSHDAAVLAAGLVQAAGFLLAGLRLAYTRRAERVRQTQNMRWYVQVRPAGWGADVWLVLVDAGTGVVHAAHLYARLYRDRPGFGGAVDVATARAWAAVGHRDAANTVLSVIA